MNLQGLGYKMDVCFVIDSSGSMAPLIEQIQARVLTLGDELIEKMGQAGKPIEQLRMRLVDFADYATEGDEALHMTDFFELPREKRKFEEAVKGIKWEYRGGDIPENGLEALCAAMLSDWVELKRGEKGRHLIVLLTDAQPLNLGERKGCTGYPDDIPETVADLEEIWTGESQEKTKLNQRVKRLILYAPSGPDPSGHRWDDVVGWENTTFIPVDAAKGLIDVDVDDMIAEFVKSV